MTPTSEDKTAVLTSYRSMRTLGSTSPRGTMGELADAYAFLIARACAEGRIPNPVFVRQWVAACNYRESMEERTAYWFSRGKGRK